MIQVAKGSSRRLTIPVLLIVLWLCVNLPCWSIGTARAESSLKHDLQLWAPVYLTFPIQERVIGYMEVNPRLGDDISGLDQLLVRPALGFRVTSSLSLWQGYAWVTNYEPTFRAEHRAYQQVLYQTAFSDARLMSRSRLEERFIEEARGTAVRARTMLRVTVPLELVVDTGAPTGRWAIVGYDEIFVNVNTIRNGPEAGFDQNRFFAGINRTVNEQVNVDVGYQLQLLNNRQSGLANRANHMLLIQVFVDW